MEPTSWKYILFPHNEDILTFEETQELAKRIGYPFFAWKDIFYTTIMATPCGLSPIEE